jgi:hypothetical protein
MNYSVEEIFKKCPEKILIKEVEYTTYEWTVKESDLKVSLLIQLLEPYTLFELERFKYEEKILFKEFQKLFREDLKTFCRLVYLLSSIPLDFNEFRSIEYPQLMLNIIKQNDIIQRTILYKLSLLEGKRELKEQKTIDVYDTILEVISTKALGREFEDLTILNWKDKLTYRQLEWLMEKIENVHSKRKMDFYIPLAICLSHAFGSNKDKTDISEMLFKKPEYMSKFEEKRRIWFKDKFNDIDFIKQRIKLINMPAGEFFAKEDIEKYNISSTLSLWEAIGIN